LAKFLSGVERSDIKKIDEGEPGKRGEPAASGAERIGVLAKFLSGVERSDIN